MNVFIVFAHPDGESLNGAFKDLAVSVLTEQGHHVQVSDLYAMKFKAVADEDDFVTRARPERFSYLFEQKQAHANGTFAQDIVDEQAKLSWADVVIFQFPMWWTDAPAIVKGWFDRVFANGFAYSPGIYDAGNLKGKKAMLSITVGTEAEAFGPRKVKGDMRERLFNIQHEKLYFCGMDVIEPFIAYDVHNGVDHHFEAFKARLLNLENLPVINFPKLADYDEHYELKKPVIV